MGVGRKIKTKELYGALQDDNLPLLSEACHSMYDSIKSLKNIKNRHLETSVCPQKSACRFCKTMFLPKVESYHSGVSECPKCIEKAGGGFYTLEVKAYIYLKGYVEGETDIYGENNNVHVETRYLWVPFNVFKTSHVLTEKFSIKIHKNSNIKIIFNEAVKASKLTKRFDKIRLLEILIRGERGELEPWEFIFSKEEIRWTLYMDKTRIRPLGLEHEKLSVWRSDDNRD